MKQCSLLQTVLPQFLPLSFRFFPPTLISMPKPSRTSSSLERNDDIGQQLTAKEKRQLRNERRERNAGYNWREEVEERLIKKPKKKYVSWKEELNLDNLALLGRQWWVVRVSRATGEYTAEQLAQSLAKRFPDMEFKVSSMTFKIQVYIPTVRTKRKLKDGSVSVKSRPLFPGNVFLWCVLNKEVHDFIRECDGVGGFLGSRVGNKKRQINKPKLVSAKDMEVIFRQAKEEQEQVDHAFEELLQAERILDDGELSIDSVLDAQEVTKTGTDGKMKRRSKKSSKSSESNPIKGEDYKSLVPGSSVQVTSGPFAEFTGCLKEFDHKTGKATVGFMLFGKESLVNLDVNQIVAEMT